MNWDKAMDILERFEFDEEAAAAAGCLSLYREAEGVREDELRETISNITIDR
jgi:hypothetical protein|tara:strand:- start:83 stop:238 length:156 start_codon:yes stop_codon:yes gene_type:complete